MKRTISIKKLGGAFALGVLTMVLGCESVAILPRDDVGDRRGYGDRRDADRRDSDRDSPRDQVYGRGQEQASSDTMITPGFPTGAAISERTRCATATRFRSGSKEIPTLDSMRIRFV